MRYDAKCFYGGKKMGDCTISDAESFEAMMEECGTAGEVMRRYTYFSDELSRILVNAYHMETTKHGVLGTARAEWRS